VETTNPDDVLCNRPARLDTTTHPVGRLAIDYVNSMEAYVDLLETEVVAYRSINMNLAKELNTPPSDMPARPSMTSVELSSPAHVNLVWEGWYKAVVPYISRLQKRIDLFLKKGYRIDNNPPVEKAYVLDVDERPAPTPTPPRKPAYGSTRENWEEAGRKLKGLGVWNSEDDARWKAIPCFGAGNYTIEFIDNEWKQWAISAQATILKLKGELGEQVLNHVENVQSYQRQIKLLEENLGRLANEEPIDTGPMILVNHMEFTVDQMNVCEELITKIMKRGRKK